jgi:hypothetical protein
MVVAVPDAGTGVTELSTPPALTEAGTKNRMAQAVPAADTSCAVKARACLSAVEPEVASVAPAVAV